MSIKFHQGFHECKDKQCNRFHKLSWFRRLLSYGNCGVPTLKITRAIVEGNKIRENVLPGNTVNKLSVLMTEATSKTNTLQQ